MMFRTLWCGLYGIALDAHQRRPAQRVSDAQISARAARAQQARSGMTRLPGILDAQRCAR